MDEEEQRLLQRQIDDYYEQEAIDQEMLWQAYQESLKEVNDSSG